MRLEAVDTSDPNSTYNVSGDPDHPANQGRLCSKGTALGETMDLPGRLTHPNVNGEQVSWSSAIETVAERFGEVITEHGTEAVAMYVSGQLLTEDYYVANKFMKGAIGSANIDTCLLYTSPSPRDLSTSRMPSSA